MSIPEQISGISLGSSYLRPGDQGSITSISYIAGGWITVDTTGSLLDIDQSRTSTGQIAYVSQSKQLYIANKVAADWITTFEDSVEWSEFSFSAGFPYSGSALITGSLGVTGSFSVSGSISSPGSNGHIIYNNGGVLHGTSSLFFDDVNNRVGIGTNTPSTDLHVVGDARFVDGNTTVRINNSAYVPLQIDHSAGYAHARINGFEVGGNTTSYNEGYIKTADNTRKLKLNPSGWLFESGSTGLAILSSAGNFGINTTTPTGFKLVVNGTTDNDQIKIEDSGATVGYLMGSANGQYLNVKTTRQSLNLASLNRVAISDTLEGNQSLFGVAYNDNALVVAKGKSIFSGSMGVGTATPGRKFHTSGYGRFYNSEASTDHGILEIWAKTDPTLTNHGRAAWLNLRGSSVSSNNQTNYDWLVGANYNNTFVIAKDGSMAGGYDSASLSIASNLDVTIYKDLHVRGTVTAEEFHTEFVSASIIYESGSTKFGDTSDDVHSFTGSIALQVSESSKGIAVDTATGIQVGKLYNGNSNTFPVGVLALSYGSNGAAGMLTGQSNALKVRGGYNSGGKIIFTSVNDEVMRMDNIGLGIGTTTPTEKLHVSGNISASGDLYLDGALYDANNESGTSGQILQSTETGIDWVDPTGISVQAEQVYATVKNVAGVTLQKGTPVHAVTGSSSGNVNAVIAASASVASTMPATFILNEDLADEAEGLAISIGRITQVDTSAFEVGDIVYVGESGGYTNVKPQGSDNLIQNLGVVTKKHASNGSGYVYGSGRSNDIPNLPVGKIWVGSAAHSVTSSLVHLDETNGRMGIGTTTPNTTLVVHGNSVAIQDGTKGIHVGKSYSDFGVFGASGEGSHYNPDRITLSAGNRNPNNSAYIDIYSRYGSNADKRGDIDLVAGSSPTPLTSGSIRMTTGGWVRAIIDFDGNMGVGIDPSTTSRGRLIVKGDFQDNLSGNGQLAVIGDVSGSNASGSGNGGQMVFGGSISTSDSTRTFGSIGGYKENDTSGDRAGYLSFGTRQNQSPRDIFERMRITSTGNVGISTTTPEGVLHVYNPNDSGANRTAVFEHRWGVNSLTQYARYGVIVKSADQLTSLGITNQPYNSVLQGFQYTTPFSYKGIALNPMGGSVAIGRNLVTGPDDNGAKLIVSGSSEFDGDMVLSGSLHMHTGGGTYYISGSDSTLSIGSLTTTNKIQLELYHSANPVSLGVAYNGGQALPYIESVHPSYDTNTHLLFKPGGTENWRIGAHGSNHAYTSAFSIKPASNGYDFYIANHDGVPILYSETNSSRIGIGTTSPSASLHIGDDSDGGRALRIEGNVGSGAIFSSRIDFSNKGRSGNEVDFRIGLKKTNDFVFEGNAAADEIMRIEGDTGKVGIGTTSPARKLHLNSATADDGLRIGVSGSTLNRPHLELEKGNTGNTWSFVAGNSDNLYIKPDRADVVTDDSDAFVAVNTSGKVGIGTSFPTYKLDVRTTGSLEVANFQSEGNAYLRVARTGTQAGEGQMRVTNNGNVSLIADGNISLTTGGVSGTTRLYVRNNDGKVGIGTTSPQATAHVSGTLRVEDRVTLPKYGAGLLLGTNVTYALGVDASGNVVEVPQNTGQNTDVDNGTEVVDSFASGSFNAAFTNYVVKQGTNLRAGQLMSVWDGSGNVEYTDVSTNSLGDTSGVLMFATVNGGDIEIKTTVDTNNWTVKVNTTLL